MSITWPEYADELLNDLGNPTTHPACEHRDCESCTELTKIEAQIEDLSFHFSYLRSRLKNLQERHHQARSRRNHVHSPLIHRFPLEIVSYIFTIAFPPRDKLPCYRFTRKASPLILGHVCRTWRELAFSTPRLWCDLDVSAINPNFPLLNHQVACSGKLPLSIHFFALSRQSTKGKEAMSFVLKQLHRTASLCLVLTTINLFDDLDYPEAAPLLEDLHVHFSVRNVVGDVRLRLAIEPPRPRRLLLDSVRFDQIALDLANISSFTLERSYVHGFFPGLLVSGRLKHLDLWAVDPPTNQLLLVNQMPVVNRSIEDLTLGTLESAAFMLKMTLPSLRKLEFDVDATHILAPMICDFVRRSLCPLQVLSSQYWGADTLVSGRRSIQALVDILETTTTIEKLVLQLSHMFHSSHLEPLLLRLSSRYTGFLPCLQTLSLQTKFTPPLDLLLDMMDVDHSPEMLGGLKVVRPLETLILELVMPSGSFGNISRDAILRVLRLRAVGKKISIVRTWILLDDPGTDLVEYWKGFYGLME